MFNLLCERADNVHGGCIPHHMQILWEESANKLGAVIRSRVTSLTLFYQQLT